MHAELFDVLQRAEDAGVFAILVVGCFQFLAHLFEFVAKLLARCVTVLAQLFELLAKLFVLVAKAFDDLPQLAQLGAHVVAVLVALVFTLGVAASVTLAFAMVALAFPTVAVMLPVTLAMPLVVSAVVIVFMVVVPFAFTVAAVFTVTFVFTVTVALTSAFAFAFIFAVPFPFTRSFEDFQFDDARALFPFPLNSHTCPYRRFADLSQHPFVQPAAVVGHAAAPVWHEAHAFFRAVGANADPRRAFLDDDAFERAFPRLDLAAFVVGAGRLWQEQRQQYSERESSGA